MDQLPMFHLVTVKSSAHLPRSTVILLEHACNCTRHPTAGSMYTGWTKKIRQLWFVLLLQPFKIQEAQLSLKDRASALSVEIWQNTAQMFDGLHLERPKPGNDLQGHSRSLTLVPFDRPHTISY